MIKNIKWKKYSTIWLPFKFACFSSKWINENKSICFWNFLQLPMASCFNNKIIQFFGIFFPNVRKFSSSIWPFPISQFSNQNHCLSWIDETKTFSIIMLLINGISWKGFEFSLDFLLSNSEIIMHSNFFINSIHSPSFDQTMTTFHQICLFPCSLLWMVPFPNSFWLAGNDKSKKRQPQKLFGRTQPDCQFHSNLLWLKKIAWTKGAGSATAKKKKAKLIIIFLEGEVD